MKGELYWSYFWVACRNVCDDMSICDRSHKYIFHFIVSTSNRQNLPRIWKEIIYLASKARATSPAARGALAEVPVCVSVQLFRRSDVNCKRWKVNKQHATRYLQPSPITFNKIRISQSSILTSIFWDSRGKSVLRYIAFAIYYFRIISPSTFQYYCTPRLNLKFLKCTGFTCTRTFTTKLLMRLITCQISELTTCFSLAPPLLYVVAMVEAHGSRYHGIRSFSDALLTDSVSMLLV